MSDKILEIKDCEIQYITEIGIVHAVNHIDFSIERGASMGLVGETGAGKTTTCLGILNLLPSTTGRVTSGEIIFNGENLLKKSDTLSRNDIDYLVTEYGIAPMRGRSVRERVDNLIAVAHPDYREQLRRDARELLLW